MPLRIPIPVALLLSLCLHAVALAPAFRSDKLPKIKRTPPVLEVRLPEPMPEETATSVSTEASMPLPAPTPAAPLQPRGRQMQRAQSALARHLLYPPEAIARELEGEVILLLLLDPGGHINSAEIAHSSGHPILDQAALAAARQINALPGNPRQTLLPVRFRLD